MSFDIMHRPEFVPNRYRDVVARSSVLMPLVKFDMRLRPTTDRVVAATRKATMMWRARITNLRDHGWRPAQADEDATRYMRNCTPSFVSMLPRTRTCNMRHVCPFCWGRVAQSIFDKVINAFPLGELGEVPREDVEINAEALGVGARHRRVILLDAEDDDTSGTIRKCASLAAPEPLFHLITARNRSNFSSKESLPELVSSLCSKRSRIKDLVPFDGAIVFSTVEYDKRYKHWSFTHRYLFRVPRDAEIPTSFESMPQYRRIEIPTRREVVNAVIRTCKYPRSLIVGDPAYTVRILHATRGRRIRATYGCFRSTAQYEAGATS
jgi:hypothetical protein